MGQQVHGDHQHVMGTTLPFRLPQVARQPLREFL
jgi:hypothetical protein